MEESSFLSEETNLRKWSKEKKNENIIEAQLRENFYKSNINVKLVRIRYRLNLKNENGIVFYW